MRALVLTIALVFILVFGFLTLSVIVRDGLDILTVLSVLVLALFGFGIVGALLQSPEE